MKKIFTALCFALCGTMASAQNGLENIIVETYYISDANDATVNSVGGVLPVGSVTYRIYVDMLPGYRFQAGFGIPGHEMRIETSTLFFNNEDRGATTPSWSKNQARDNTVMLDSWLSVGSACNGQFGVLKTDDDGVLTNVNNDGVLQNNDIAAGIPLTQEDGMVAGSPQPVTIVGISTEILVFDNQNDGTNGPLFSSSNGSWASLNGSIGADSLTNKVLIAQLTTDGDLCFKLNIQIGTPSGGVEQYVAENPVGNEIYFPGLTHGIGVCYVGVNETNNSGSLFNVYPNPTNDLFTMEIKASKQSIDNSYTIYDIAGNEVQHKTLGAISGTYMERVDISKLAAGYYVVQLSMDGTTSSKKLIKN